MCVHVRVDTCSVFSCVWVCTWTHRPVLHTPASACMLGVFACARMCVSGYVCLCTYVFMHAGCICVCVHMGTCILYTYVSVCMLGVFASDWECMCVDMHVCVHLSLSAHWGWLYGSKYVHYN